MKTVLIIGMGRFGVHLAQKMAELGNQVMVVDKDEDSISELLPVVTRAQVGDCMDAKMIESLGVKNFDVCFVCTGSNFQASLEITSQLKELGAPFVVSKTDSELHEKFLLRNGADAVVYPERDVALRTARKYSANNIFDYFEFGKDFSISEIGTPPSWVGKTIMQVGVRARYGLNILAVKTKNEIQPVTSAERVFRADEHLIVAGTEKASLRLENIR